MTTAADIIHNEVTKAPALGGRQYERTKTFQRKGTKYRFTNGKI